MKKRDFIKASAGLSFGIIPAWDFGESGRNPLTEEKPWRWSREAMHYEITSRGMHCKICPNGCTLKPGETSKCRNRIHHRGKLYSIAYGNPCAVHVDPIEKKPLFHFFPGSKAFSIATAGCNLACMNCQNWSISQASPKETHNYELFPQEVVSSCIKNKCSSIAYTYSEPTTFYEYMTDSCRLARQAGIYNTLHSNGYILEKPLRELCKFMDAVNIDLKSFDENIYLKLNAGSLAPILNSLKIFREEGVWLEITNLIIPGWTDSPEGIRSMCNWLIDNGMEDVPLHFSRFYPQHKLSQLPPTPLNSLQTARSIAQKAGMKYIYIGNFPGAGAESTMCPACKKTVILRKGYQIIEKHLVGGKCSHCQYPIAGVWA